MKQDDKVPTDTPPLPPTELHGYHFTSTTLRNGSPIPLIGEWLVYDGDIIPCQSGLHMSIDPFDALQYTPGSILHKVVCRGIMVSHKNNGVIDKFACSKRMITHTINAELLLRRFAKWNALQVIHLYGVSQIVKDYLSGDDESIREAAKEAAWEAAKGAAWEAARGAAWEAARGAAWEAAWEAARVAAWEAARGVAWEAARGVAILSQRTEFNRLVRLAFTTKS